jgi:hypothetical protein
VGCAFVWPDEVCASAGIAAPRHADSNANASQCAALHLLAVLVFFPVLDIGLLTDTVRSFILLYPIDGRALSPAKQSCFFFIFVLFLGCPNQLIWCI